jgi:large subunit ribosomal protein L24
LPPANAEINPLEPPRADITVPGRGPHRAPRPRPAASAPQPMASQQLAPLPPPIVVRPAPHPVRPKPRLPLLLTPAAPDQ